MPDFWEWASDTHRDGLSWVESELDELLRARSAHALADATRSVLGHEAFAVGFSYGLFTAQSHVSAEMGELIRTFALAEAYDVMFGRLGLDHHSPFGFHIPLRALADAIGHDSMIHFQLETAHHHREALMRQLREIIRHRGAWLAGLPDAMRRDFQAKWDHVAALYQRADVADRFEAGKRAGELFWELLNLLAALVALGLLAREVAALGPDLVRLARGLAARTEAFPAEVRPPMPEPLPKPIEAPKPIEPKPIEPTAPAAPYEPPPLTQSDGRSMLREAIGNLKKMPPEAREAQFRSYREDISAATNGQWTAKHWPYTKNGSIYAGEGGEALVFDDAGNMYRGQLGNEEAFVREPGGILIEYSKLKPL